MSRVLVCATYMGGFWDKNSVKKGPFSADYPETCMAKICKKSKWVAFRQN